MVNVLVVYYSRTGNTKAMAETIADAAHEEGAVVRLKEVADASTDDLVWADGIVIGSPVYSACRQARSRSLSKTRSVSGGNWKTRSALPSPAQDTVREGGRPPLWRSCRRLSCTVWSCAATQSPREGTLALLLPEHLTIRHLRSARV